MKTSIQYSDLNDSSKYFVKEYLQNGNLIHEAEAFPILGQR
jgi:hypothetical protein